MNSSKLFLFAFIVIAFCASVESFRRKDTMERCPMVSLSILQSQKSDKSSKKFQVKPMRNFQLEKMMGFWYVVQYYSSTEEQEEYKCMRGDLEITDAKEVSQYPLATFHVRSHEIQRN
jgi:hypothetical protein